MTSFANSAIVRVPAKHADNNVQLLYRLITLQCRESHVYVMCRWWSSAVESVVPEVVRHVGMSDVYDR